jgi:hypothetical protein
MTSSKAARIRRAGARAGIPALLVVAMLGGTSVSMAQAEDTPPGVVDVPGTPESDEGRVDGTETPAPLWTPDNDQVPPDEVTVRAAIEGISEEEALQRYAVEAAAAALQTTAAARYADTFAGLWLTQEPFGVSVAFTRHADESVAELADEFAHPALLKAQTRSRSLANLLARQDRIAQDREAVRNGRSDAAPPALAATGGNYDIGIDVVAGEVTVHVERPDDAMRADLARTYGEGVTTRAGVAAANACGTFNCGSTMMSGLQLTQSRGTCSSAFTAYGGGYRYVLSAGHCYTNLGSQTARYHASALYGHTDRYGFSGNVDAERIRRTTSFRESSKFVTNNADPVNVNSYIAQSNVAVGTYIGKTGRTTGTTRGYVTDQYFDPGYVSGTGNRFFVADLCSDAGDSGSGVWRAHTAYGVLSGGWDNQKCRNVNGNFVHTASMGPTIINGMDMVLSSMNVSLLYNLNLSPVASWTNSCDLLMKCSFNGGGSSDPDGSVKKWAWTFGDGTSGSGVSPTKTYSLPGTYTVRLTVTDNNGATASSSRSITVL